MVTTSAVAQQAKIVFDAIKARGGHAAIDFKDGELSLICTKPTPDTSDWGRGAVPQSYGDGWVRLVSC